jgi:antitoxin (DNA-binding transcriptional repressor) of toxin-antitoxin stability system
MSAILQQVQNGEIISLTQRGTEIARLVPPDFVQLAARQQLEELRKTAIVGNVLSPIDDQWEVIKS